MKKNRFLRSKYNITCTTSPNRTIRFFLIMIVIIFCSVQLANAQSKDITVKFSDITLSEAIKIVEKKSDYVFFYNNSEININKKVSVNVKNSNISELLALLIPEYKYRIETNKIIILSPSLQRDNQVLTKKIQGVISDSDGEAIIGATVSEKGNTNATMTDVDGVFSLNVPEGAVVVISYLSFKTQEIRIDNRTNYPVTLLEDNKLLDEVVVVGFATQKKVNLTGAVGTVDMKDMVDRPVRNATQMLQGVTPGLNITQGTGGALNSTPSINIRGLATIGDGSTGSPLILIDGMEGDINAINPQDIANISVLKDASTSSIYGSRAAFGVILVTTKQGKAGKTTINYNNNLRLNTPINMPDMVDSYRFAIYFNDARAHSGETPMFSDSRILQIQDFMAGRLNYSTVPSTDPGKENYWAGYEGAFDNIDWYDAMYKKSTFSHEHNISITGGTEKFKFYASGNYLDQNGLMKINTDNFKRYTSSLKVAGELTSFLDANFTFRYVNEDYHQPTYMNDTFYFDLARQGWPVLPLYDPNGHYFAAPSPALNIADGGTKTEKKDWLYQQYKLILEPIGGWKTNFEFNHRQRTVYNHTDVLPTYNYDINGNPYMYKPSSSVQEFNSRQNFLNLNVYTEYTYTKDKHYVKGLFGYQNELNKITTLSAYRQGVINPDLPILDLTSGLNDKGELVIPTVGGNNNDWATAGFFGRINYHYDNKYMLEFNLRYDGTSRYRRDQRWNWFPSVSAGWNIAEEKFMESFVKHINMLKVRGSYGTLGNQNTNSWYPTYQTLPVNPGGGAWLLGGAKPNVSSAPGLISSTLTWERVRNWNIGLDYSLSKNRLTGSLDYFVRNTIDMVGPAPELPNILGTSEPKTNNTNMKTYGFEASIGWQDKIGDVGYNVKFNLSDSQTKILDYPNETNKIGTYRSGQMYGEIWGYETIGIAKSQEEMDAHLASLPNGGQNALGTNWSAGDVMYSDLNGDGRINSGSGTVDDPGDRKIIGSWATRYPFSFNLGVDWKGFALNAFFQGVMKKDIIVSGYYFWGIGNQGIWQGTAFEEHMNYFREDPNHPLGRNIDSYYPRPLSKNVDATKNQVAQTRYMQDASYIRLKSMQLSYTFPRPMTQSWGMDNLRLYISGENLWTGTKMSKVFDPETVYSTANDARGNSNNVVSYPLFRVVSAGLSVTF